MLGDAPMLACISQAMPAMHSRGQSLGVTSLHNSVSCHMLHCTNLHATFSCNKCSQKTAWHCIARHGHGQHTGFSSAVAYCNTLASCMHIGCDVQTDLELELIERLKKKQVQQQQALQELQEAMALTSRSPPPPSNYPLCNSNQPQTLSAAIMCMLVGSVSHFHAVSCKPVVLERL